MLYGICTKGALDFEMENDLPKLVTLARLASIYRDLSGVPFKLKTPDSQRLGELLIADASRGDTPEQTNRLMAIRKLAGVDPPDPPKTLWEHLSSDDLAATDQ